MLHYREKIAHNFKENQSMSISESGTIKRKELETDESSAPPGSDAVAQVTKKPKAKASPITTRGVEEKPEPKLNKVKLLSSLKDHHDRVVQGAKDLLSMVESDETWAWCRHSSLLQPLQQAVQDIDVIKNSSELWKTWTLSPNFGTHCQKHVQIHVVNDMYDKDFGKMKGHVKAAKSITNKLKKMQADFLEKNLGLPRNLRLAEESSACRGDA